MEPEAYIADFLAEDRTGARLAFWLYDGPPHGVDPLLWLCVGYRNA